MSTRVIPFRSTARPWQPPLQCKRRLASGCLLSRLQVTLDPRQLMSIYWQELRQLLEVEGLSWRYAPLALELKVGVQKRPLCTYRLRLGEQSLGELIVSRSRPLVEQDKLLLEQTLDLLAQPLYNALLYQQALAAARCDPLTGVGNRAAFDEALAPELELAQRHKTAFSLLLIDIDRFKHINDSYGHAAGDTVLSGIAAALKGLARQSDLLFRYAGDEFVILMRQTEEAGAYAVAERIRSAVEQRVFRHGDQTIAVQLSIGFAVAAPGERARALFERADQALLVAKRSGRNQISWTTATGEVQRAHA